MQRELVIDAMYGKPTPKPYRLAQNLLNTQAVHSGVYRLLVVAPV